MRNIQKKWPLMIPITVGIIMAGSYFYTLSKNKQSYYPAEKVITSVKDYFQNVTGSYIVYEPTIYRKFGIEYEVYKGGISAMRNGKIYQYTFIADAYDGEVIDIIEV
ncbi:hypothetical protein [Staphylococcus americanisciuri]|uniref:Peptidase propeptide and YPEB domain-containing protein n=1 Tax=Staphylococcus americanisciuri TaxID=2973940 RepID=A0ABT2EYI7_9STAP|nr:hypothetical protein [Staphylococcus americanisciuri]MCS4485317.1 hypothetical protein [Staphylococcus americanisciuri]